MNKKKLAAINKKKKVKKHVRIEEQIKSIQTISVLKFDRKNKKPSDNLSYFGIDPDNYQNTDENIDYHSKEDSNLGVKYYVNQKYFIDEKGFL